MQIAVLSLPQSVCLDIWDPAFVCTHNLTSFFMLVKINLKLHIINERKQVYVLEDNVVL